LEKKLNILIDENIPYLADILSPYAIITKFSGRDLTNKLINQSECRGLYVRSTTNVDSELLQNTQVEFVATATSGIDHIDIEYLKNVGIQFADAAGSNSNSVAEMVVYSTLKWLKISGKKLDNSTIGIIGYGNIGKIVAKLSNYLGLNVLINDPPLLDENFKFPDFVRHVDIKTLCSESDIITNHVPLTKDTKYPTYYLIDYYEISLIKKGSLLIHTSRGKVVNENPLLERLLAGTIYTAIDVWENEPIINKELARYCILATPHVAGYSRDGKLRGVKMMAEAFQKFTGFKVDLSIIQPELNLYNPIEPDKYQNIDFIYNLLLQNRKFDNDQTALLETLNLPDEQRAKAFDLLRKNYPVRRESL
jgi:erythronate-4-phosphate dehydrogenase